MRNLIATVYFLLSLVGCQGGTTFATQASVDGQDVIYSKTRVQAGIVRFECVRSASGQCHYTLFPRECTADPAPAARPPACTSLPVERFTVAAGDHREVVGMQAAFDLCVRHDTRAVTADCREAKVAQAAPPAVATADG